MSEQICIALLVAGELEAHIRVCRKVNLSLFSLLYCLLPPLIRYVMKTVNEVERSILKHSLLVLCTDSDVPCAPLVNGVKVGWAFGLSVIEWSTQQLFKMSRQYRSVSMVLEHNKLRIKMNTTDRALR